MEDTFVRIHVSVNLVMYGADFIFAVSGLIVVIVLGAWESFSPTTTHMQFENCLTESYICEFFMHVYASLVVLLVTCVFLLFQCDFPSNIRLYYKRQVHMTQSQFIFKF